jgi:tetratricopeptide (TPR) repeat protein
MNYARAVALRVGLAVWGISGGALGGESAPQSEAERVYWEGVSALKRGEYETARAKFELSMSLSPRGTALFNLGCAEAQLGKKVEALRHIRDALKRTDLAAQTRAKAEREAATVYEDTGHLLVQTDTGASVAIDGVVLAGQAPLSEAVDVMPGSHRIEARVGSRVGSLEVDAPAGKEVSVEIRVERQEPAAIVAAEPEAPGGGAIQGATADAGEGARHPKEMEGGFWSTHHVVGAALGGGGVLAFAASGYFHAQATDAKNRAASLRSELGQECAGGTMTSGCSSLASARSSENSNTSWQGVMVGVGVASIVAGAAVFFWPRPDRVHTALVPLVSPEGGFLDLYGEF